MSSWSVGTQDGGEAGVGCLRVPGAVWYVNTIITEGGKPVCVFVCSYYAPTSSVIIVHRHYQAHHPYMLWRKRSSIWCSLIVKKMNFNRRTDSDFFLNAQVLHPVIGPGRLCTVSQYQSQNTVEQFNKTQVLQMKREYNLSGNGCFFPTIFHLLRQN